MEYQTPEVVLLGSATEAIQMNKKGVDTPTDLSEDKPTIGAYEADE